jgi:hypothetical protein
LAGDALLILLFRAIFAGKSKRVPDGDHPGAEVFDGGGEVVVGHDGDVMREGEVGVKRGKPIGVVTVRTLS